MTPEEAIEIMEGMGKPYEDGGWGNQDFLDIAQIIKESVIVDKALLVGDVARHLDTVKTKDKQIIGWRRECSDKSDIIDRLTKQAKVYERHLHDLSMPK